MSWPILVKCDCEILREKKIKHAKSYSFLKEMVERIIYKKKKESL